MGGILTGYALAMVVVLAFGIICLGTCGVIRRLNLLSILLFASVVAFGQGQSGQQVTYKGPLTVIHEDPPVVTADNPGIFHYFIDHDGRRDSLGDFTGGPQLGTILTGTVVEATGTAQNNGSLKNSHIKPPPPPPQISISGAQTTLIMAINFSDTPTQPFTLASITSAYSTVSNFVLENSYETAWVTPTVVGWFTLPDLSTTCDPGQWATDANAAATTAGVNLSNYTHYVYIFPNLVNCPFAGTSTVGGNPSQTWINGSLSNYVLAHEMGHAYGLWHSHALDCANATICSNGAVDEYGDNIDTMGYPQGSSPDYNSFQHAQLGWLNFGSLPPIQTVTTTGLYTLTPIELVDSGPKALKVLKSTDSTTGAKTWYYLESRQATGFDSFLTDGSCPACLSTQNETTGILFHLETDNSPNSSLLITMHPTTPPPGFYTNSLTVGQTFTDSAAGVSFTPTSVTSTTSSVQITFGNGGGGTGGATSISCTAHPLASSYTAGTTSSIDIHVTNNLGNVVSGASVTQSLRKTNGSTTPQSCSSNSGGDAVCTYKIKNPDPLGTWSATETVALGTLSTSCGTTFLVN